MLGCCLRDAPPLLKLVCTTKPFRDKPFTRRRRRWRRQRRDPAEHEHGQAHQHAVEGLVGGERAERRGGDALFKFRNDAKSRLN